MNEFPCLMLVNESGFRGGGAERRIVLLLKHLLKRSAFKRIVILHSSKTIEEDFKAMGLGKNAGHCCVEFIYLPRNSASAYDKTCSAIRDYRPVIIQLHNTDNTNILKAIAESKIHSIFVAHDYWPLCGKRHFIDPCNAQDAPFCTEADFFKCVRCRGLRSYLKLKAIRRMINRFDRGVSPTRITREIYEKHDVLVGRWEIISPWIDTGIFRKKTKTSKRNDDVLFVGSLADYKGAWVIARAFASISASVPDARLLFIGPNQEKDGLFRKKIEGIAIKNGFFGRVKFLGNKSWKEIAEYHEKCGVYVCPTVWPELFGLNWAEALASGCPVVASRIGGIPELLDGYGILVRPRDTKELADAVIRVLKDKKLAERMGKNGSKMALSRFDVKRACDEFVLLYADLARTNAGR